MLDTKCSKVKKEGFGKDRGPHDLHERQKYNHASPLWNNTSIYPQNTW